MEIKVRADGSVEIEGYVNAVGRDSRRMADENGYPYVEQMQPGVFARALNEASVVYGLLDHDMNRILADTNGTLELEEDTIGLHANMRSTDPELIQKAREGKLRGWSFGFIPLDSKQTYETGVGDRTVITELELVEVSVIDDQMVPCYAGTSVHTRANGDKAKVCYRAYDNDVIYRTIEGAETKPAPKVDYTPYDAVIDRITKRR